MKISHITIFQILLLANFAAIGPDVGYAGERQGAHIIEMDDEDGDRVIAMETDWISMHLMPALGATAVRFVFRPTQNEILGVTHPKNVMSGGGLMQDNVWEQDWRFQELRAKWYDYEITKTGPDEVQVTFQTQLVGWLGADDSGLKSKLLENLIIRRTVTLRQGTPYFLFDYELINPDENAKLPLLWSHNSSRINLKSPDYVFRPSELGINAILSKYQEDYIHNFNHGWSARVSPERKEGIVYIMDYDYLSFLYNCGIKTSEWVYDNYLVFKDQPVKSRIYVLPTMGLEKVDHATEYFIVQLKPIREEGRLRLQYKVVSSYEKARKITFIPEVEYALFEPKPSKVTLGSLEFAGLGIEPTTRDISMKEPSADPVLIKTTAFVELADGTQKEMAFEYFHIGKYGLGRNILRDLKTPVRKLTRPDQNPHIPIPSQDLTVNRKDFKIFAILGNHGRMLKLEKAMRRIRDDVKLEVGYHPGFDVGRTGLTDFPYDYERLFDFRVVVLNNSVFDSTRLVGLHILHNYFKRGGGLVFGGGENTFGLAPFNEAHPIYDFLPFDKDSVIRRGPVRINSPAKDHPIFKGINLSDLPWQYYVQQVQLKPKNTLKASVKVLLKAGDQPLIVEYNPYEGQRSMIVLAVPYGDPAEFAGKTTLHNWSEWQKLYANIVRYAGHDR
jgi:uncharacterized membrane protein